MDLTKETIEKIIEMDRDGATVEVDGEVYSTRNLKPVFYQPRMSPIELSSLSGLVGFLASPCGKIEGLDPNKGTIVINDVDNLALLSEPQFPDLGRTVFASVCLDPKLQSFPWGEWLEHEAFIIKVRALFVQNEGTAQILQFTSRITSKSTVETEDDGITQRVVTAKGASGAVVGTEPAPVVVKLMPYRTFREAEQPESEFLFRMSLPEGKAPRFALFEADGGRWRDVARGNIAAWLSTHLLEHVPIIY